MQDREDIEVLSHVPAGALRTLDDRDGWVRSMQSGLPLPATFKSAADTAGLPPYSSPAITVWKVRGVMDPGRSGPAPAASF